MAALIPKILRYLTASGTQAAAQEFLSTGLDFVPGVGNLKSFIEAISGTDMVSGRELSALERSLAFSGIFIGGIAKVGGKAAIKGVEVIYDEGRAVVRTSSSVGEAINEGTLQAAGHGYKYWNRTT